MTNKRRSLFLLAATCAALLPSAPAAAQQANGWGVKLTDVTPDPAVRYGTLPNGMRYAIMRNALPKGAGALRLRFEFGSIGEAENERGLAHFIEHMAFNGSTNVRRRRDGQDPRAPGSRSSAPTPMPRPASTPPPTCSTCRAPRARRSTRRLMLMREVAGEVKFDPKAIDRERGVILGERRVRDTFQLQQAEDQIGFHHCPTPLIPTAFRSAPRRC